MGKISENNDRCEGREVAGNAQFKEVNWDELDLIGEPKVSSSTSFSVRMLNSVIDNVA